MEKSLFAGLTILRPDESLTSDDGAFTGRDRETIDRFLEIGAKTHRHNARPGLPNPQLPLQDVTAIPSGGTIAADTTFTLGYTLVDGDGGETMLSPTTVVTTPPPLEQPLFSPAAVVDYADGGTLMVETYYYTVTFIDSQGGETPMGPWVTVEREPGFPNARILLSGLSAGAAAASASGWRLYRAVGGGTFDLLAFGGSAASAFTDDGSISVNCDIHPPTDQRNTTNNINQLRVVLPGSAVIGPSASAINVYGTDTGAFLGDVLLGNYPASSAGHTDFYTSYRPDPGAPPDRNHSIGGASKIDPDTELLDWHWKRPVQAITDLPAGAEEGDVRVVKDEDAPYLYDGTHWRGVTGPPRRWASAASAGVASGATATFDLNLADFMSGARLLRISTSKRSRVRVYGRAADRTADLSRAADVSPSVRAGVLLDYPATAFPSGMIGSVGPAADCHNLDDTVAGKLYLSVTNLDATGTVTVGFLILPTEYR